MSDRIPAEVFPPGEFLREELGERGWTQAEFAEIVQRDGRSVSEIINGKRAITPGMARRIGAALGTSAELWLNLQSAYQLWKLREDDTRDISRMARLRDKAPIGELVRRGWIQDSENIDILERNVLDFFGLTTLEDELELSAAARKSTSYSYATPAQKAWVCRARQLAPAVHAQSFSRKRFGVGLCELRACASNAQDVRHVPKILANMGVRIVAIQHLPGTKLDGACFWMNRQPIIALSLRYDRIDWFWFTLMHELGHVFHEDFKEEKEEMSIDDAMDEATGVPDEREKTADLFAREQLVGRELLESFIRRVRPLYSKKRIEAFASRHNVHPGIVVGQLQFTREIPYKNLRKMLVPVRDIFLPAVLADGWGHILPTLGEGN